MARTVRTMRTQITRPNPSPNFQAGGQGCERGHLLSRHKSGIVALLRPGRDGWSAEDWQVFFDERAGIADRWRSAAP